MQKTKLWAMLVVVTLILAFSWSCSSGQEAPRVDKETLKSWLADPQVVIVDVRFGKDWQDSNTKIKSAIRHDSKEVQTWAASLPKEKKIVLYCA
jgi:rhodanese-related sulfurtransferase